MEDDKVTAIRRVVDASVREQMRQQKAILRSARTATESFPGSSVPNSRDPAQNETRRSNSSLGQNFLRS
jgi:hypothetical protein